MWKQPQCAQVYDKDQVYPEYLVLYERLHGTRPPEPPPKDMPYLLELPLYWKNVGKNPRIQEMCNTALFHFYPLECPEHKASHTIIMIQEALVCISEGGLVPGGSSQDFHDHWLVRPKITNLIYRLALHTSANTCPKAGRDSAFGAWHGASWGQWIDLLCLIKLCGKSTPAGATREKGRRLRPLVQIHQLEETTEPTATGVQDGKVYSAECTLQTRRVVSELWVSNTAGQSGYFVWFCEFCLFFLRSLFMNAILMQQVSEGIPIA